MNAPLAPYKRRGTLARAVGAYDKLIIGSNPGVDVTARFATFSQMPFLALAAVGLTQASAAPITQGKVVLTCSASAQGARLPTLASAPIGSTVEAQIPGTKGVKLWPDAGVQIDALATNNALALAAGKAVRFLRRTPTQWVSFKGA